MMLPPELANSTNARILLLDDDLDFQKLVEASFRSKGYVFTSYGDPSEAFSRAKTDLDFFSNFDLVLTDFRMPKVSGMEFLAQFRVLAPETPIILLTSTNRVSLAVDAIRAGAYDFVVKPINVPQLGLSIERALAWGALQRQNCTLRSSIKESWSFNGIVGKSAGMQVVFDLGKRVARSSSSVLVLGESGTGKEVIAKAIHQGSPRAAQPFVAINCSAIPEALLESELFGHAKGSFTGAADKRIGLFEEANGGTLFLDEIADLNLPLQAKLLRVLQERKIKRIGENVEREIDVRILAATHGDLRAAVKAGRFREDLYFRLNVIQIRIPPLRERREDIIPLALHFFEKFSALNKGVAKGFSRDALAHLESLSWKGNVRELENTIERAVVLAQSERIETSDLANYEDISSLQTEFNESAELPTNSDCFVVRFKDGRKHSLDEMANQYVRYVVDSVGGVKDRARKVLDIDRKTLSRKLEASFEQEAQGGSGILRVDALTH